MIKIINNKYLLKIAYVIEINKEWYEIKTFYSYRKNK